MRLENGKLAAEVLWTEAAALALAAVIYLGSSLHGYFEFLLLLAASTLSVVGTCTLLRMNSKAHGEKISKDEYDDWLYSALYCSRVGIPYLKAMEIACRRIRYAPLKEKILSRLKQNAMHAGAVEGEGPRDRRWTSGELKKDARKRESNMAEMEESAQRYATFNMFISTVLPSFMIFAFIGSSILSNSSFSLAALAAALLLVIPALYSFGNVLMWRRLFV